MAPALRHRIIVPMESDTTISQRSLHSLVFRLQRTGRKRSCGWKPTSRKGLVPIRSRHLRIWAAVINWRWPTAKRNLWGEPLTFLELESEHSSASTCEGFALAGGRVANFTSGQGLILMKEVLYVIAGKRLPVVFHIGSRALTSQGLNIHAGHDDVMGVADCGWGMLFARNVQEAADLALIARRIAEESETPFFNIQDGFLTTHTIESLRLPETELMKQFVGDPSGPHRLRNLMDPAHPVMSGVVQNQDSYMKGKIAQRYFYDRIPAIMKRVMEEFCSLTGRRYEMIDAFGLDDAECAIVGMGSLVETAKATAKYLREREGVKVGTLHVTSFRPFPGAEIVEALKDVKSIAVIERMDNPAAQSNPLAAEIKAAFGDALSGAPGYPKIDQAPVIYSGSAGLGSRDVRPGDFVAVVDHSRLRQTQRFFVLGASKDDPQPGVDIGDGKSRRCDNSNKRASNRQVLQEGLPLGCRSTSTLRDRGRLEPVCALPSSFVPEASSNERMIFPDATWSRYCEPNNLPEQPRFVLNSLARNPDVRASASSLSADDSACRRLPLALHV